MITMTRIQGSSMGFANFQKPILQSPRMGGIFDFQMPQMPQFPDFNLPLAAGSPSGGADGGGAAPAPAPAPGAAAPAPQDLVPSYYPPQQTYVVTQQPPVPAPTPTAVPEAPVQGVPTWAIVGGSVIVGMGLAVLFLRQG
jgi:hypothetical protein